MGVSVLTPDSTTPRLRRQVDKALFLDLGGIAIGALWFVTQANFPTLLADTDYRIPTMAQGILYYAYSYLSLTAYPSLVIHSGSQIRGQGTDLRSP
jgi:hypothetical protein